VARRVSLPSADDLFRRTEEEKAKDASAPGGAGLRQSGGASKRAAVHVVPDQPQDDQSEPRKGPSGRVKHDEKMTVYVTADELLEIEHARLALRSRHALAVDRGRLVREAIHLVLADLEQNGEASALVRRLTEEQ
jgi:hypothetical protein